MRSLKSDLPIEIEICSCFATKHPFLTSCLYCGWISCINNKLNQCGNCKEELIPIRSKDSIEVITQDKDTRKAYELLDKLLLFDSENSKRTHVYDAQGDYYEHMNWLTEEEKKDIEKREKLRIEKHKSRKTKKVKICFDIAGRRVVHYNEEFDDSNNNINDTSININQSNNHNNLIKSYVDTEYHIDNNKDITNNNSNNDIMLQSNKFSILSSYENNELELNNNKAGEIYRSMKKRLAI